MGRQWLGLQMGSCRLRRRRARRNWFRTVRARVLHGPGPTAGEDDAQFPASQCLPYNARHRLSVVRVARFQWRLLLRCQFEGRHGVLEQQPHCSFRRYRMGDARLEARAQVVHGRMVFRDHLRPGRRDPSLRLHHTVGERHPRNRHRRCVQFRNQESVFPQPIPHIARNTC